jgi:hypothetical protein
VPFFGEALALAAGRRGKNRGARNEDDPCATTSHHCGLGPLVMVRGGLANPPAQPQDGCISQQ